MARTGSNPGQSETRWMLLIHQIPPKPAYLRIKIGRHLRRIGAVAIKNSVYALPRNDETQEDFQWVRREVVKGGGDASIVEARFIDGLSDEQVLALFQSEREAIDRRFCLCTDDRRPADLLDEGSIDHLVRLAIAAGLGPVAAIRLATLNAAEHFRLRDRGAVAPGRRADLVAFDDLSAPRPDLVWAAGRLVARGGALLDASPAVPIPRGATGSVHVDWSKVDLRIPATGRCVRVIRAIPDEIVTGHEVMEAKIRDGEAVADPARDLLEMAVIERHGRTGTVGRGFVTGVGLRRGAISSTVAHDHHNLVVIGADDRSLWTAARAVVDAGGGQAAVDGDRVLALLPLPIAGLMSDLPIEMVRDRIADLVAAARALGSSSRDPFMAMSFLALEVVPKLKLTDMGLVDVERFAPVPLFVEDRS